MFVCWFVCVCVHTCVCVYMLCLCANLSNSPWCKTVAVDVSQLPFLVCLLQSSVGILVLRLFFCFFLPQLSPWCAECQRQQHLTFRGMGKGQCLAGSGCILHHQKQIVLLSFGIIHLNLLDYLLIGNYREKLDQHNKMHSIGQYLEWRVVENSDQVCHNGCSCL